MNKPKFSLFIATAVQCSTISSVLTVTLFISSLSNVDLDPSPMVK